MTKSAEPGRRPVFRKYPIYVESKQSPKGKKSPYSMRLSGDAVFQQREQKHCYGHTGTGWDIHTKKMCEMEK
jgi:hypothetical protein